MLKTPPKEKKYIDPTKMDLFVVHMQLKDALPKLEQALKILEETCPWQQKMPGEK